MSTDTLEFPEIIDTAPAVAKTTAIAESIGHVQGEVAKFDAIAAGLRALEAAHPKNVIVAAINTPAGMKLAEAGWRAYRNPRLEVERARKAAKAPVLALGKAIDSFAGDLETALREGEDHYKAQIEAEQARVERERAEAAAKEQARKDAHLAFIATIRGYLSRCQQPGMTAARIDAGIAALKAVSIGPEREEFEAEAKDAHAATLAAMMTLHSQALSREAEAARQEAIRLENERVARELAAERERIAAEAEALRRQAAELENEKRRQREAEEAAAQAEAARLQAEAPNPVTLPVYVAEVVKAEPAADAPVITGTPDGHLCQDLSRGLTQALASKPDAMLHAREAAAAIEPPAPAAPTHAEFVALVLEAFKSRLPTQPNMPPTWWAKVRAMGEALQEAA